MKWGRHNSHLKIETLSFEKIEFFFHQCIDGILDRERFAVSSLRIVAQNRMLLNSALPSPLMLTLTTQLLQYKPRFNVTLSSQDTCIQVVIWEIFPQIRRRLRRS